MISANLSLASTWDRRNSPQHAEWKCWVEARIVNVIGAKGAGSEQ